MTRLLGLWRDGVVDQIWNGVCLMKSAAAPSVNRLGVWLGGMPALLKGFLEQVARPGYQLPKVRVVYPGVWILIRT